MLVFRCYIENGTPASLIAKGLWGNSINFPLLLRQKSTNWSCKLKEVREDGWTKLIRCSWLHRLLFFILLNGIFSLSRGAKILRAVYSWSFEMTPCNEIAFDIGECLSNLGPGWSEFFLRCFRTKKAGCINEQCHFTVFVKTMEPPNFNRLIFWYRQAPL